MRAELTALLALAIGIAIAGAAQAAGNPALQPSGRFSLAPPGAAATPPMGWNPWNAFRTEVTEDKIMAVAAALKRSGLADAGYRYVNLDDGWWLQRGADGRIVIRTAMFPSAALADGSTSLRPFVERLHGMGLKAGIYTDIGRNACSQAWDAHSPNLPVGAQAQREVGSFGFQAADMRLIFGEWGFDYVKVDACGLADYDAGKPYVRDGQYRAFAPWIVRGKPEASAPDQVEALYAGLRREIAAVRPDQDYVLSICAWGEAHVADWARRHGHSWRTSPDIRPTWASMLRNFDSAAARALYAGPGHWNDPDMLEIGLGEFDARHPVEARAHMSLWAIIGAPLILGADLTWLAPSLLEIAGKREVIAINQDGAGNQGVTVAREGDTQVVVKSLAERGARAVALVNRGERARKVTVPLARLYLDPDGPVALRDLWTGEAQASKGGRIAMALAPHETRLLLVRGQPLLADGAYLDEMPARVNVAAAAGSYPADWVPARVGAAPSGQPLAIRGKRYDRGLGVLADTRLEIRLDGEFGRFRALAGASGDGAIVYRVYGDGRLLFERTSAGAVAVDVTVGGVRTLELVAQSAGEQPAQQTVAWAEARLLR